MMKKRWNKSGSLMLATASLLIIIAVYCLNSISIEDSQVICLDDKKLHYSIKPCNYLWLDISKFDVFHGTQEASTKLKIIKCKDFFYYIILKRGKNIYFLDKNTLSHGSKETESFQGFFKGNIFFISIINETGSASSWIGQIHVEQNFVDTILHGNKPLLSFFFLLFSLILLSWSLWNFFWHSGVRH